MGFSRLTGGLDKGGYYHELFLRGKVSLAYEIHRQRVKGTGVRLPTNPDIEPNFYALPLVTKDALPTIASMDVTMSALSPVPVLSKPIADTALSAPVKLVVDGRAVPSCESRDCLRRIEKTKQQQEQLAKKDDVLFFEGHPFHYLDSSAFTIPNAKQTQQAPLVKPPPLAVPPNLVKSYSSVVSESDSDCDEGFLPSLSHTFDEDTSSVYGMPLQDDIDFFFQSIDMPMDMYHEQIELMSDDDDAAFGNLLEKAIS